MSVRSLYRKYVPVKLRKQIRKYRGKTIACRIPMKSLNGEQVDLVDWMKVNGDHMLPYNFIKKYRADQVEVFYDDTTGLNYVMLQGKRLYWRRGASSGEIQNNINSLLIEQDQKSPHCYFFSVNKNYFGEQIVVDLGVAEGNFALSIVEQVKQLYLFECDSAWIEALNATFAPWKEKVTIVQGYVGNGPSCISLDDYFRDKEIDFIKADIEGAEVAMLLGSSETMKNKVSQALICLYHKFDDEANIKNIMNLYGYQYQISDGYMCFWITSEDDFQKAPFRRGLLYAKRAN